MSQGMPLEGEAGIVDAAVAKTLFVRAVQKHLPDKARAELGAIDVNTRERDAREWAKRWRIDCPCVVEWASGYVHLGSMGAVPADQTWGAEIPDPWWDVLAEWNDTKLRAGGEDPRDEGKAREKHDPPITTSPIAANPLAESRTRFIERAKAHWDARAKRAHEMGYTPIRVGRELERYADWLARQRLLGESLEAISRQESRDVSVIERGAGSVRAAVGLPPLG